MSAIEDVADDRPRRKREYGVSAALARLGYAVADNWKEALALIAEREAKTGGAKKSNGARRPAAKKPAAKTPAAKKPAAKKTAAKKKE